MKTWQERYGQPKFNSSWKSKKKPHFDSLNAPYMSYHKKDVKKWRGELEYTVCGTANGHDGHIYKGKYCRGHSFDRT